MRIAKIFAYFNVSEEVLLFLFYLLHMMSVFNNS